MLSCLNLCDGKVSRYNEYIMRTPENYTGALNNIEDDRHSEGVVKNSPLNALTDFHETINMPPCVGHDMAEGVLKYDLHEFLKYFVNDEKYSAIRELNRGIDDFLFSGRDSSVRPAHVKFGGGIIGTASQLWCLIRFLSVLIGDLIPEGDEKWLNMLNLRKITTLMLSPDLTWYHISQLNILIGEYLERICVLFPTYFLKSMHHFIQHAAYSTVNFGPLIHVNTLRFEAKHQYFKRVARNAQNYKKHH